MKRKLGEIHCKNRVEYVELTEPLYDDFYQTQIGIFRFGNPVIYKNSIMILRSPDLTLPDGMPILLNRKEKESQSFSTVSRTNRS